MAFTINLDPATEKALKAIMDKRGIKTKNKAMVFVIHAFQNQQQLEQELSRLRMENEVLMDINLVSKITDKIQQSLNSLCVQTWAK